MNDRENIRPPAVLAVIEQETIALGFSMASELQTGSLLRTLAATKPAGVFLELGTGTGLSTAWILDGMDNTSILATVDNDASVQAVARRHLGADPRVTFHTADGATFLETLREQQFDFIFADTWPGKYDHLKEALQLLRPGGLYLIDDMLPQPNWPPGHAAKVPVLVSALEKREDLQVTKLGWASGIVVVAKKA
jgi:predicted O-methyltransferase YrrM